MTPSWYEPSLPHIPLVSPTKPLVTLGAPQMSPLQPEPYTPQGQSHRKTRGPVICHCLSAALEMGEATWHPEQRGQLSAVSGQHGLREKRQRNHRVYDGVERIHFCPRCYFFPGQFLRPSSAWRSFLLSLLYQFRMFAAPAFLLSQSVGDSPEACLAPHLIASASTLLSYSLAMGLFKSQSLFGIW